MVRQKRRSLPFVPPFPEKDDPWKSLRPELNRHAQGKFEAQGACPPPPNSTWKRGWKNGAARG
jgi:hypothetical protein